MGGDPLLYLLLFGGRKSAGGRHTPGYDRWHYLSSYLLDTTLELNPKLLERRRGEWRARGELAFPGSGRRGPSQGFTQLQRTAELERKIGQLTMENDFLKKPLRHFRDHHPPAVVNGEAACLKKSGKRPRKGQP